MLFDGRARHRSDAHRRVHAAFEIAHTAVDFGAAAAFLVGSVMFLSESWQRTGTWLFIVGSVLFAAKPTLRLAREIRLASMGETGPLARDDEDRGVRR